MNFFKNDNTFLRSAKNCVFQPSSYPQYYCECGNFENFGRFWEILGNFGKFWEILGFCRCGTSHFQRPTACCVTPSWCTSADRPPVALHRRLSQPLSKPLTASHFFRCLIVVYCRYFADYRGCILCFARRTARECTTVLDRVSIAARHKMRRENRKIKKNLRLR